MNPETFAEWMRRQRHHVYQTESSYWYDAGPHVLQAFPYHWLIRPSREEIHDLMTRRGIVSLRYSAPVDFPEGKISYHIVLQYPYSLELLKAQARNGVKRGLKRCKIEQIPFERLATDGWVLQQDTLERQNRSKSMNQAEWEQICRSAADLPGFEAWAATLDGELASALIVCQIGGIWNVPYATCHRKFLPDHANNALFYSVSTNLLARAGTEQIFFTVQSLDAPPTVDDFKLRMGLVVKPVRQRVEFHPWLKPLATPASHQFIARLLQRDEGSPTIAKAEGMLRFHLQGKQPLAFQQWPECLAPQREEILNKMGDVMNQLDGCQIPTLPHMAEGHVTVEHQSLIRRMKRALAVPWNYYVKKWLKRAYGVWSERGGQTSSQVVAKEFAPVVTLQPGDLVRVRSKDAITSTLNPFKELKGCAFLENMDQYCDTRQRVFKAMDRFLDERDYKVKKVNGVILLENVICQGTPAFGRCDRSCFLFWRQEWLEKVEV